MFFKRKDGQAMVEFALVLPVLILLICGIIDFGWIFGNQIIVNNATREAARYTAIHYNDSTTYDVALTQDVIERKAENLDTPSVTINIDGEEIIIRTQGTIPILTPFTSIFLGDNYTMRAKSVMRME